MRNTIHVSETQQTMHRCYDTLLMLSFINVAVNLLLSLYLHGQMLAWAVGGILGI